MTTMQVSNKGLEFLADHEGFASNAYKDVAGVWTIGFGFTSQSEIFASFWEYQTGRKKIKAGDVISRGDALRVLRLMCDSEYGEYVNDKIVGRTLNQHEFDACVSVVYNLGPRALKWSWFRELLQGYTIRAHHLLRETGAKAGGRRFQGLVDRRYHESNLLAHADYRKPSHLARNVAAQKALISMKLLDGAADGIIGPKTKAAIQKFQKRHDYLLNDGVLGPATYAALTRVERSKEESPIVVAAATVAGGAIDMALDMQGAGAGSMCTMSIAGILWRYRNEFKVIIRGLKNV